ncbi:hypothetical protein DRO35_01180 [Candidatus Bathyarchaeota archaeon]|nr:MAG: hypothetical protein DRO35_01180 [Candidatus Bathyarchaeota archaeon]
MNIHKYSSTHFSISSRCYWEMLNVNSINEKIRSIRRGSFKTILYILILIIFLSIINFVFGEAPFKEPPLFLQPYKENLMVLKPLLMYVRAALVFIFGYYALNAVCMVVYTYTLGISDHPTAAMIKSITKISGIALLLGLVGSMFNVSPAAALTMGSFGGMVIGFASQTVLTHVIAGIFLLITRPFSYGDIITISGHTGRVKEIRLMHIVLDTGDEEILIPSGTVIAKVFKKKKVSNVQE